MPEKSGSKTIITFILLIVFVTAASHVSVMLRGGKPETIPENVKLVIKDEFSLFKVSELNKIPPQVLVKAFKLEGDAPLKTKISDLGLSSREINKRINKALALYAEHGSKNWKLILTKFVVWILFLSAVFAMIRKGHVSPQNRKWIYFSSVVIFGVVLGADPAAMGTVKDAIVLFGSKGVIFPPRMIALTVFLLMAFLANKFICSWGCQLGALQDLVFRLNRNDKDGRGILKQYKPSFLITNTLRIIFFLVFTFVAFIFSFDLVGPIDPFKIYKPAVLGLSGAVFVLLILVSGLFIYRPWCHLFCPFGLVSWLVEKISLAKIHVDYDSCIACEACSRACPSTVMGAILKRDRTIPDCFSCATCINVCPTESISFKAGKRALPPENKFDKGQPQQDQDAENQAQTA